jgi:hypothetical protein
MNWGGYILLPVTYSGPKTQVQITHRPSVTVVFWEQNFLFLAKKPIF